jgi:Flp pilus assembly protein TadD/uncharacterized protein (AIM24 family)
MSEPKSQPQPQPAGPDAPDAGGADAKRGSGPKPGVPVPHDTGEARRGSGPKQVAAPPSPPSGTNPGQDRRLAEHLAAAGELVAARRFREAEIEVLRALSGVPGDLRALNLLALVRFKLGRLEEARATYREIATSAPRDPAVRRNLGLLALKAERIDEAVGELELAVRLAPGDKRAWSYLGYAYTRRGDSVAAAAAFRRAGQDAIATEIEQAAVAGAGTPEQALAGPEATGAAPAPAELARAGGGEGALVPRGDSGVSRADSGLSRSDSGVSRSGARVALMAEWAAAPVGGSRPPAAAAARAQTAVSFALGCLGHEGGVATGGGATGGAATGAVAAGAATAPIRLSADDGAFVRADAALASTGAAPWERAFRRVRGVAGGEPLGTADRPFYRMRGDGAIWVAGAGRWTALALEDDILFLREDRVLGFDGDLLWEAGRLPGDGLPMLQFRGRGRVVIELRGAPAGVKVADGAPARVSRAHLYGWLGRVVAHARRDEGPLQITCEGEGVMLLELGAGGGAAL